jgi:D-3-phosphoglycerate dehydrogenase
MSLRGRTNTVQNTKTILVPETMAPEGFAVFEQRADLRIVRYHPSIAPAEFHVLLQDAVGIALSFTRLDRAALAAAPNLAVAARIGVGFDAVDVPALTERGIPLMVVGIANARSVAEHAVFFMFALAKRVSEMDRIVRQGLLHERKSGLPREVSGKTVLILGFGRIGSRVAPRCRALEMNVVVYDPYKPAATITDAGYEVATDLDAALARADYVTIHCPKNTETIGLFNAQRLAGMKPGAFLINTARGGIVDEAALADALRSGHLAGAALDVYDPEPPDPSHPLLQMENVLSSPHMAGVTSEAWAAMAVTTATNIIGVIDGSPAWENAVNATELGN